MSGKIIHGSYGALLFNPKWREKRQRILERDGFHCVICGSSENLIVHHKQYHVTPDGMKYVPWNYDDRYLITVCKNCHQSGHAKFKVPVFKVINKNNH